MAARRLMPGGRGVAERRRDELSASPLRRGASTQTSWTSSAQVHKRLRGGRYRTGNAIYELQFLGDLWSVEIKARRVWRGLPDFGRDRPGMHQGCAVRRQDVRLGSGGDTTS